MIACRRRMAPVLAMEGIGGGCPSSEEVPGENWALSYY